MNQPFGEAQRIELKAPPLELVICQLRFPTILALADGRPPEEFQRRISGEYPLARKKDEFVNVRLDNREVVLPGGTRSWCFDDLSAQWTVTLGDSFLALEANRYRQFKDFSERFMNVLSQWQETYPIALQTRLGLRYVDRISHARNPELPRRFADRINPELIAFPSVSGPGILRTSRLESRFCFPDRFLTIRSMYSDQGFPGAEQQDELILDFDCYHQEQRPIADVQDSLVEYKKLCYQAFRWCIGDLINCFESMP